MGKYRENMIALIKGVFISIVSRAFDHRIIEKNIRLFPSAKVEFDKGSKIHIAKGVKIRERSFLAVRTNGFLEIGRMASVGMDNKIVCHEKIVIGEGTLLSPNVLIYDHDHIFDRENGVHRKEFKSSPVIIGKNCWIGANTVILRGTIVGDNCIVGAGSVLKGHYEEGLIIKQDRMETSVKRHRNIGQEGTNGG